MKNRLLITLIIIIMVSLLSFIFGSCKIVEEETLTAENEISTEIILISVEEVFEIVNNDEDYFILDVRTWEEYDESHIWGVTLIPIDELEERLDEIPKDKPIIVYCRSGIRSNNASNILIDNGFTQVYDMSGGILEWMGKDYPLVVSVEIKDKTDSEETSEVISISVDDSYEYFGNKDYIFLDVRSLSEYESGHIEGALHIHVSELESRLNEIPKDKYIIAYCNGSGCARSSTAANILINNGYSTIYNMAGQGVIEWEQKGYPIER